MPICTYMSIKKFNNIYNSMDDDMRELCDDIQNLTGERYAVRALSTKIKNGWWPFSGEKTIEYFTVLCFISNFEVQCINLMSGLGGGYTRNEAAAFLIGVRAEAIKNRGQRV